MTDLHELDMVVLRRAFPERGLVAGDVGAVVHVSDDRTHLEVEFVTGEGQTVALLALRPDDVRIMEKDEILHVRDFAA